MEEQHKLNRISLSHSVFQVFGRQEFCTYWMLICCEIVEMLMLVKNENMLMSRGFCNNLSWCYCNNVNQIQNEKLSFFLIQTNDQKR